jgi:hypothetical protein
MTIRKTLTSIVLAGALALGVAGCKDSSNQESKTREPIPSHFASVPMRYETGLSMTSGDFDGDGDLDLVIGAYANGTGEARAYKFNNDGEGNFSQ